MSNFGKRLIYKCLRLAFAQKAIAAKKKSTTFENLALTFEIFPCAFFEKMGQINREKLHRTRVDVQKKALPPAGEEGCLDFFFTKGALFRAILLLFPMPFFCKDFSEKL